ncbi:cytochrome oxidase subunit 3, putative (mitochondrion) [Plasmodium malariae]|uniref:Cytochrome oxidase subunit 3, putative n=1 Tax=Plasmodium malariae TaxID=5858 RepID=A0A1D3JJY3_PLAMA|nr:cytochrome oxidase subunit 3, putative [Plasmodium malariae]
MLSIIISEALFLLHIFGVYYILVYLHVLYMMKEFILTSSRMLILTITFTLASASCMTACLQFLLEKGMSFEISSIIFIIYLLGECFASLQTTEYLHLEYYINDGVFRNIIFMCLQVYIFHMLLLVYYYY